MKDCIKCKKYPEMPNGKRCEKCDNGSLFIPDKGKIKQRKIKIQLNKSNQS